MMDRLSGIVGKSSTPRADLVLAAAVGVFAAVLLYEAAKIPPPYFDPLGSAAVPKGVAAILAVLVFLIFLRGLAAWPWPRPARPDGYRLRPDIAVGVVVVAVGYVAAMASGLLGFRAATIAFVILATATLGRFEPRLMLIGAVVAVAVGFGGAHLFTEIFFIALP